MGKGAQREGGKSQFDEKMEERFAKIIEVFFYTFLNTSTLTTISRLGKNHRTYVLQVNHLLGWIRRWAKKKLQKII